MEFGVFAQLFVPKFEREADPAAEHKRIMRNVEIARTADRSGFKYVWCPQHHFLDEYSHMPGPEAFLSFCAAQTERVHLGSAIFNITPPVNKPVRVAENVRCSTTSPATASSSAPAGVRRPPRCTASTSPTSTRRRRCGARPSPRSRRCGRTASYSYEGTYFRVPERQVFPKPNGPAHPAMWVAAGSPPTFTEAGEMGLGAFCFSMGGPAQVAPLVANYKNAIGDATPVGDYVNDNIMGVTNMLCMEDRKQAFETAAHMQMNYYTSLAYHWLDNIPKPKGLPEWPDRIPEPTPEGVEKLAEGGFAIIGDPDDCAKALRRWEEIGVDQLTLQPHHQHAPHRGGGGLDGAVRPRGHPAVRHGPGALHHPVPRSGGARPRRLTRRLSVLDGVSGTGEDGPVPQSFNFADLWEAVGRPRRRPRGARLRRPAAHLRGARRRGPTGWPATSSRPGCGRATTSASACRNRVEWLEAFLAAFTIRAVPINLNHRYTPRSCAALLETRRGQSHRATTEATAAEVEPVVATLGLEHRAAVPGDELRGTRWPRSRASRSRSSAAATTTT